MMFAGISWQSIRGSIELLIYIYDMGLYVCKDVFFLSVELYFFQCVSPTECEYLFYYSLFIWNIATWDLTYMYPSSVSNISCIYFHIFVLQSILQPCLYTHVNKCIYSHMTNSLPLPMAYFEPLTDAQGFGRDQFRGLYGIFVDSGISHYTIYGVMLGGVSDIVWHKIRCDYVNGFHWLHTS